MKMLVKPQLFRLAASHVRQCYSTLSIHPITAQEPIVIPQKEAQPNITIENTELKDPVVNLLKVRQLFKDQNNLYNKIDLLVDTLKNPEYPVRIGLLNPKKSLLNSILSDPFSSNQSWFTAFKNRNDSQHLIKYNDDFEISEQDYVLPSPFLQERKIEFVESKEIGNDSCHLYVSFDDKPGNWPVYSWRDVSGELSSKEIDSEKYEEGINLLMESPKNSPQFTELFNQSNIQNFIKFIDNVSIKEQVILKLYESLVQNLKNQQFKYSLTLEELTIKDSRIKKFISEWDESTHIEFQKNFKPYIESFERSELSWFKLYYKNDDIPQLFKKMLDKGLLNDSLKNYSYLKGSIDSFSAFNDKLELNELDHNELTNIKNKFINEDSKIIQKKVVKLLLTNFIGIQLPIIFISSLGYFLFDYSLYSMAALGSLGLTVGFNNVSKNWVKYITEFKTNLYEAIRIGIVKVDESLINDWSIRYNEEKNLIMQRTNVINDIEKDI